jgi:hypothetical protein
MIIRTVNFSVGVDSIVPQTKQYAGIQGDHCSTNLVFTLDDDLISQDYIYRVEMVDSMNKYKTTETLMVDLENRVLEVPLTRWWTQSVGLCEVRLVVSKLDFEYNEEFVLYSFPAHIYFESRLEGIYQERETEQGLTALIESVKDKSEKAYVASLNAEESSTKASTAAEYAISAADNANVAALKANNAAISANSADYSARNAANMANNAADYANQMAQAADNGERERKNSEAARVTAEQARVEAENTRVAAEGLREQAENQRQAGFMQFDGRITAVENGKADKSSLAETNLRVAEIGKDISDYKQVLSQLNPSQEAKQNTTDYGTVSLPANTANGQVDVSVGGVTATNLIQNGNFANGTTGWGANDSTRVVIDNILIHTANEGTLVPTMYQDMPIKPYAGQKVYVEALVEVSQDCTMFDIYTWTPETSATLVRFTTPTHSTYALYSGVVTHNVASSRDIGLYLRPWYSEDATNKVMKVKEVMAIDLTATFGADSEPTVEQCNKMFANWFDGTVSTPSAMRIVSENEDETERSEMYIPDCGELQSLPNGVCDEVVHNKLTGQWEHIKRIDNDGKTALPEPIITPINVTGTLISHPKGTIYAEPVLPVAGIYITEGIAVTNTDFPIDSMDQIVKIDFATGLETPVDVSQAVIAEDRLSFTHEDLSDGDIVFFTYYHSVTGTQPKISATYYDSRYTVKDSVNGKFYRWKIGVANGIPSLTVEEV